MSELEISIENQTLIERVRTIISVPDVFLADEVITSPIYSERASKYIKNYLSEINEEIEDEDIEKEIQLAYIYYICGQICISMPLRLPLRMENISTKTLLSNIDWEKFADEMMNRCNDILDNVLEDMNITEDLSATMIELSDEATYPNSYM